jgi:hypothetical protein
MPFNYPRVCLNESYCIFHHHQTMPNSQALIFWKILCVLQSSIWWRSSLYMFVVAVVVLLCSILCATVRLICLCLKSCVKKPTNSFSTPSWPTVITCFTDYFLHPLPRLRTTTSAPARTIGNQHYILDIWLTVTFLLGCYTQTYTSQQYLKKNN